MAEPAWYYAQNDEEKGPVTPAQLKALAQSGKLKAEDLVWKEGMDDWTPAGEVRGLVPGSSPMAETAPLAQAEGTRGSGPGGVQPVPMKPPGKNEGGRWSDKPAAAGSGSQPGPGQQASGAAQKREGGQNLQSVYRWIGLSMLLGGMLLAVSARGCDSISKRYVSALQNKVDVDRDDVEKARASSGWWGVVRQVFFLLGTMVLTVGLLAVGIAGKGAERWMSFIILALIVFSLYVAGMGWGG